MNKINLLPTVVLAGIITLLIACREDEQHDPPAGRNVPARFIPSICRAGTDTRAVDTEWSAGDKVGVCMLNKGEAEDYPLTGDAVFYRYKVSGQGELVSLTPDNTPGTNDQTIYYPLSGEQVRFIAFAPYREISDPGEEYAVAWNGFSDQSSLAGMEAVDFLYCEKTSTVYGSANPTARLEFKHGFSKLMVQVGTGTGAEQADLSGLNVTIGGVPESATVSLANGRVTAAGTTVVTPYVESQTAEGYEARAIIVPHPGKTGRTIGFRTETGMDLTYVLPEEDEFEAGKEYMLRFKVTPQGVTLSGAQTVSWAKGAVMRGKRYTVSAVHQVDIPLEASSNMLFFRSDCPEEEAGELSLDYGSEGSWLEGDERPVFREKKEGYNLYSFTYNATEYTSPGIRTGWVYICLDGVKLPVAIRQDSNRKAVAVASANCYIVPPGGRSVYFPVTPANSFSANAIGSSDVLTASLLWSDNGSDLISPGAIRAGADGLVSVTSNSDLSRVGNAVVAVKVNDEIKWSWHIWVTDYNPEVPANTKVYNGYTLMDRSLGAMNAVMGSAGALGLYYQWGRKDPFPRSGSGTSDTEPLIYDATDPTGRIITDNTNFVNYHIHTGQRNIASIVKEPHKFIHHDGSWLLESSGIEDLWSVLWTNAKSPYDPCPAGWRVPAKEVWSNLEYDNFSWQTGYGREHNQAGWFPANGFRDYATGIIHAVSIYGYYWSASISSVIGGHSHSLYFNNSGKASSNGSSRWTYGIAVRCVRSN